VGPTPTDEEAAGQRFREGMVVSAAHANGILPDLGWLGLVSLVIRSQIEDPSLVHALGQSDGRQLIHILRQHGTGGVVVVRARVRVRCIDRSSFIEGSGP